eukprot:4513398-Alexandrium_andersonii.AAC.1
MRWFGKAAPSRSPVGCRGTHSWKTMSSSKRFALLTLSETQHAQVITLSPNKPDGGKRQADAGGHTCRSTWPQARSNDRPRHVGKCT